MARSEARATNFDALAGFSRLHSPSLGRTASRQPTLGFPRDLPRLGVLWLDGHDRDFEALGDAAALTRLHLQAPRAKSRECLRGHTRIEVLTLSFGG